MESANFGETSIDNVSEEEQILQKGDMLQEPSSEPTIEQHLEEEKNEKQNISSKRAVETAMDSSISQCSSNDSGQFDIVEKKDLSIKDAADEIVSSPIGQTGLPEDLSPITSAVDLKSHEKLNITESKVFEVISEMPDGKNYKESKKDHTESNNTQSIVVIPSSRPDGKEEMDMACNTGNKVLQSSENLQDKELQKNTPLDITSIHRDSSGELKSTLDGELISNPETSDDLPSNVARGNVDKVFSADTVEPPVQTSQTQVKISSDITASTISDVLIAPTDSLTERVPQDLQDIAQSAQVKIRDNLLDSLSDQAEFVSSQLNSKDCDIPEATEIMNDKLENTEQTVSRNDTPFQTYSQPCETENDNSMDVEEDKTLAGFKLFDKPVVRDSAHNLQELVAIDHGAAKHMAVCSDGLSNSLFDTSTKATTEMDDSIQGNGLSAIIARRPDLMDETSMSSQSSRDSVEQDLKTDASKATSEVESESGSVKEKKKPPAKRRNDLTQKMEEVPTTQPEEYRPEEHLHEYRWPLEGRSDTYMLQEQISEYLGVLSFKRKYPDLERRNIDVKERVYLRNKGVVTEMQADLGLTAVRADLIYELMVRDYPQKYKLYLGVLKERRKQQALERQKEIQAQKTDKNRLEQLRQKAMQSASKFNAAFNRERREERRAYFDIHTFEIQYPKKQSQILPPEATKPGPYPVALIPGQFQDYHKKYSPTELRYLPVNTTMYSSPCKVQNLYADPVPLPSDAEEVSADEAHSSEVSTEASDAGSDVESMEMGSELFEEEEEEEEQPDPGRSPEQRKGQISRKVQEILERLKDKDNKKSPGRRKTKTVGGDESPATKRKRGEDTDSEKPHTPQRRKRMSTKKVSAKPLVGGREAVALCNICGGPESHNASGVKENLVQCAECRRYGHPSCLELTPEMIELIKTYPWQCMECKTCVECKDSQNEDKMLFCDRCDRGYHTFCVGLTTIPNGRWECPSCRPGVPKEPKIPIPVTPFMSDLRQAPTSGVALIAAVPHSKAP